MLSDDSAATLPPSDMSNSQPANPALVTIWVLQGQYTPAQKAEMIRPVGDTMTEVIGRDVADPTWVVIEEIHRGDWWFGGREPRTRRPPDQGGA